MSVEDRIKQLQEAHRDFGPASQHFLSSKFFECEIWRLSQTLTPLYSRFPYDLRNKKFLFHVVIYLPVFVGVFLLRNSTDILTGMLPSRITLISCWAIVASLVVLFFVLCLLQGLTFDCSRISVCYNHISSSPVLITTSSYPLLPLSSVSFRFHTCWADTKEKLPGFFFFFC